ncbi:hypothetical protein ZYGR_0Z01990 [Zygosaccharomyces rouxii]|uniref:ZYRO0G04928p n=2 Tax=Zygosaccharomyces rouxii TaxID=4956 RepID=C5DZJ3_ZYGRC|nr:uncharacterized protein ZYRO0G04928g [Zygosaccharomyces rouxii]KAH9202276.1 hypothetical protein LQ764DRAFT_5153 [Zygosaccharomyces rouxii]GAV50776.1 hypothetical protein ZYGR_0Z01990 [Zygosaccharomyces rouxii]CAR29277.1 ZYRO0G04928p [Zygosaccharomyces rouxii]
MNDILNLDESDDGGIDASSKENFYWDRNNRGDIWISSDRKTVEWQVANQCIRRFYFQQPVIKANFVDFEKAPNCLVIVLKDVAHVYYISQGDSTIVCFPFPIANVFWYSQGLVLERKVTGTNWGENDNHRFITLSDPMLPFGFLGFSTHQRHGSDLKDIRMVLFPEDDNLKITVLFDNCQKKLHFYYTQVTGRSNDHSSNGSFNRRDQHLLGGGMNNNPLLANNSGSIISSGSSSDAKKNLRKISILNRRATSATLGTGDSSEIPSSSLKSADSLSSSHKTNGGTRRSLSATLDRMSSGLASPVAEFSNSSIPQSHNDALHQRISTRDVTLTKISSMTLPQHLAHRIKCLKCISLKLQNREAVAIFDPNTRFYKLWMTDLLPEVINSLSFKVYGNSPNDMIRLSNFNVDAPIIDMCIYHSYHFPGTLALVHESNHISLYNPFFELASPKIQLPQQGGPQKLYYISDDRMVLDKTTISSTNIGLSLFPYPKKSSVILCFEAMKWICSPSIFQAVVFLWQFSLQLNDKHICHMEAEFSALEYTLTALMLPPTEEADNFKDIHESSAYIFLAKFGLPYLLPKIIMGLHLIREEMTLNVLQKNDVLRWGKFLQYATTIMDWPILWREYYATSGSQSIATDCDPLPGVFAHPLDEPPSIMKSLYSVTENSYTPITPFITFSRLVEMDSKIDHLITPRSYKVIRFYEMTHASDYSDEFLLQVLTRLEITKQEINTFPLGLLAPLCKMLAKIEEKLCQVDVNLDLSVISRHDLERCVFTIRQLRNDTAMAEDQSKSLNPYRAPLKLSQNNTKVSPKDIYTVLAEVVKSTNRFTLERGSIEENADMDDFDEGYTLKKNAGLIFSDDRRFYHVLSLLVYYKPRKIQFLSSETEYTKLLKQKKSIARVMSLRTCTSGIGFGAVAYATEKPLATQKWIKASLDFTYLFPDNTKVSIDPDELDQETLLWGEFHSGVSSGLRISKKSKDINGSWIAFNKPKELDAQHGGFLLGLGLNGHLKGLEEWHVYNYLSPKKTHISIGLLLGMSASMKGTMDLKLTKVLSVHIVALLPPGSSDLNINLKVQTAGLIGIGLLYQRSQHRRMCDVLFSQLKSLIVVNEEQVSDESYRLAAGISLGLINLGVGDLASGDDLNDIPDDIDVPEPLPIGGMGPDEKITRGLLEIITKNRDVEEDWIPENSFIGAIMALMLTFLKTGNLNVAESIKPDLKYIPTKVDYRPEIFMYREWAYHMILWETIGTDISFIMSDFTNIFDSEINTDKLPVYYTMAGRVLSIGIRYASSGDIRIRDCLLYLVDKFLPFYQYPGDARLDFKLTILGINALLNVLLVSTSLVMCGTGDLETFRRTRYLHEIVLGKHSDVFKSQAPTKKTSSDKGAETADAEMSIEEVENSEEASAPEVVINETNDDQEELPDVTAETEEKTDDENQYSKYIATSMSLGFLFLGSGQYALKTSSLECLSYLIISVLPTYKRDAPLQETKHFWSMAVEPRCLVIRDAETEKSISNIPIEITVRMTDSLKEEMRELVAPCLLPDVRKIRCLRVKSPLYYPLEINFDHEIQSTEFFKNGTILYVQRRRPQSDKPPHYRSIDDIQLALRKRMDHSEDETDTATNLSFADKLFKNLECTDSTMMELEKEVETPSNEQNYNLEMLCSDINSGDVTDCQLELWKRKHRTLIE